MFVLSECFLFELWDRFEIWQVTQQHSCPDICQSAEYLHNSKHAAASICEILWKDILSDIEIDPDICYR